MPKGIPLTEEEQARRRKEIFHASVHLFLNKGFNETSMREIAEAAGIGKSTLYDYFRTKDEILLSFVEDEIQRLTEQTKEIAKQEVGAQEGTQAPGEIKIDLNGYPAGIYILRIKSDKGVVVKKIVL